MSPFLLETIKCLDGKLYNLEFHQRRFDWARKQLFANPPDVSLAEAIEIPEKANTGLFRCRLVYAEKLEKIEFVAHQYRSVKSLKLVEDNKIDYQYKYTDRSRLLQLYEMREDCDDILIVKDGCITDSYTANSVFFDGLEWWTPDTPLLPGTQRARLLETGKIKTCRIRPGDLSGYSKAGLINAMQDLENMPVTDTREIK